MQILEKEMARIETGFPVSFYNLKNCPVGPQIRQLTQFFLNFRGASWRRILHHPLHRFQVVPRGVCYGGFNASPKTQITDPEKCKKRCAQHKQIQQRQAGSNGQIHSPITVPTE